MKISQKILPFNLDLELFGNSPISGVKKYCFESYTEKNDSDYKVDYFSEHFAIGQFQKLSNSEKLSRPSFQKEDAGIEISAKGLSYGSDLRYILEYETEVIDEDAVTRPHNLSRFSWINGSQSMKSRAGRIEGLGVSAHRNKNKQALISVVEDTYSIVSKDTLTSEDIGGELSQNQFRSYSQSRSALEKHLDENPEDKEVLQIVNDFEILS